MTSFVDVAIIGAGPYGLSVAAYLRGSGVEHRIFGEPMAAWQNNMPAGMHLKSDGSSSDLVDPERELTLAAFCREHSLPHDPRLVPIPIGTFVSYGLAFQARYAPQVERKRLLQLSRAASGYLLRFDDGDSMLARHVVIAVGVVPFGYVPPELRHLPAELASHSSAYGPLDGFAGREVTVLGAGSSALDLAALLQEQGARVTLVSRRPQLKFHGSPGWKPDLVRRVLGYRPSSKIGNGWLLRLCDDAPQLVRLLPESYRLALVRNTLGPSGGYFIKDRVLRNVDLRRGRIIGGAEEANGRVRLATTTPDGGRETVESDHLVMATGYKVDLARLGFLDDDVRASLRLVDGSPALSANYEGSLPGLYFIGLAAANSFGPVMRFVAGAGHPAARLGRHLSHALLRRPVPVPKMAAAE